MDKIFLFLFLGFSMVTACNAQEPPQLEPLNFTINSNVKNASEDYSKQILKVWKDYLLSNEYVRPNSPYWHYEGMNYPDYAYISLLLDLRSIFQNGGEMQCNILGIIPVEKEYYLLKSMFTQTDSSGQVDLKYITTVYAKKVEGEFKLLNSIQYQKQIYETKKVGSVNYIIHPEHKFNKKAAKKMNEFNIEIAKKFEIEPIEFDYVVANHTDDLSKMLGLDFFSYSHQPVRSGGMADNYNTIIYAGNNSEYYPHEVVHLYTHRRFRQQYHSWVDEGIAAFFGGSTGYELDWHLQKLKAFLKENPEYDLSNLTALEKNIPNGEYMTDFRYAVGGFIAKQIFEKEGMRGLFDALQAGRSEENYFDMIEAKLGVSKNNFGNFIKKEVANLPTLNEKKMNSLKY